jgi:hypothetical protein
MADYISGIKHITPSYPVKPVQPVHKDRETDRRQKPKQEPPDTDDKERQDEQDGDRKPTIDERV